MYHIKWFNGTVSNRDFIIFLVNIQLCPHQVAPPVQIMPRPFFHERGIACGTTCDKVPMAKMDTVKDLSIISHSCKFFLWKIECKLKPTLKLKQQFLLTWVLANKSFTNVTWILDLSLTYHFEKLHFCIFFLLSPNPSKWVKWEICLKSWTKTNI